MPGRSNLGPNCVDTEQIYDACITGAKIVPGTITAALLAAGILTNGTRIGVAYAAIDGLPLTGGKLTAGTIPIGTVPGGSLVVGCVTFARTAFDGNTAITIGRSGFPTALIPTVTLAPINSITGDDPAACGIDLYVAGVFNGGSLSAGSQTKTPVAIGGGTQGEDKSITAWPTVTTPDNWTNTQGTLTPATITTWAHPRSTWQANDTIYNAYLTNSSGTVGLLDVYIFYLRGVMSG